MDLHPEYGLTLLKDNYNAFQPDSFNKDECTKLRADKWKTCHPNNSDLHPCTADMTIEELHSLFKKHQSCYHFRAAENQSLCFDTPDQGHIKAERIELNHTEQCRILLEAKKNSKEQDIQKVPKVQKENVPQKAQNVPQKAQNVPQKAQNVPQKAQKVQQNVPQKIPQKEQKVSKESVSKESVPKENASKESVSKENSPKEQPVIKVKIKKYKWWVYVLGIVAIIGIGLFLFYVY
jgi:hypothetical protein